MMSVPNMWRRGFALIVAVHMNVRQNNYLHTWQRPIPLLICIYPKSGYWPLHRVYRWARGSMETQAWLKHLLLLRPRPREAIVGGWRPLNRSQPRQWSTSPEDWTTCLCSGCITRSRINQGTWSSGFFTKTTPSPQWHGYLGLRGWGPRHQGLWDDQCDRTNL